MDIHSDNLIDLISEKYIALRKTLDIKWNNSSELPISNSEGQILSLIYQKETTASEIAQQAQISRQAAHKNIKSLVAKNLIQSKTAAGNNRKKILKLTPLGEECFIKNETIKNDIEKTLIANTNKDDVLKLKETLKNLNWN